MIDFPIAINGVTLSSKEIMNAAKYNQQNAVQFIMQKTHCTTQEANDIADDLFKMQMQIVHPPKMQQKKEHIQLQEAAKDTNVADTQKTACPRCSSTQITTGARGWKWTTGFLCSGKTVNRCANCGYTWEPKYWSRQNR